MVTLLSVSFYSSEFNFLKDQTKENQMYFSPKFNVYIVQLLDIPIHFLLSFDQNIYYDTPITPISFHVNRR